jgi:flagellar biosynthesis protein FliP
LNYKGYEPLKDYAYKDFFLKRMSLFYKLKKRMIENVKKNIYHKIIIKCFMGNKSNLKIK